MDGVYMITVEQTGPSTFKFDHDWPAGQGIQFTLKLIDPDGDKDERIIIWKANESYDFREGLEKAKQLVEELPHWRAELTHDNEIEITTLLGDPYEYSVKVSILGSVNNITGAT